jgi:adenosylhomocysteine nucleosidase
MKNLFLFLFLSLALISKGQTIKSIKFAIVISANAEWKIVQQVYPNANYEKSVYGEYFYQKINLKDKSEEILFFHGGWGKVDAAGSTQFVIDRWNPSILINLGTCGGFAGSIEKYSIILVNKTIIYDIIEQMGDSKEAVDFYSSSIDLSWLPKTLPVEVIKTVLVSADRDIIPSEIAKLKKEYNAIAADWETGAIANVCKRNNKRILILRGVTDLVNEKIGEAYGNEKVFVNGTEIVMKKLLTDLPKWLSLF